MDKSRPTDTGLTESSSFEAVVSALLKGEKVFIPRLGHLSVVSISDKKTVLFKSLTGKEFERGFRDVFNMDALVARPLREGKVVNIPEIGKFRPIKSGDGSLRVSYTVSPVLRDLLNGIESVSSSPDDSNNLNPTEQSAQVKREVVRTVEQPGQIEQELVQDAEKLEKIEEETVRIVEKPEPEVALKKPAVADSESVLPKENETRKSAVGDQIVDWEKSSSPLKRDIPWDKVFNYAILGGMIILLLFFLYSNYFKSTGNESRPVARRPEKIMSPLTELAEQNYGNSAFWVYIYESNREKLESPVNVPQGLEIVIPDLQTEYGVDPTNGDDIRNAVFQGNVILGLITKIK
jgi:hypothetical protein